jgi:hypothetical protein
MAIFSKMYLSSLYFTTLFKIKGKVKLPHDMPVPTLRGGDSIASSHSQLGARRRWALFKVLA